MASTESEGNPRREQGKDSQRKYPRSSSPRGQSEAYRGHSLYYADLHNHCNISYAHGSLDDALRNAGLRLDVVSVTGHAHWPDMPSRDGKIDHIIDFHEEGFDKLKRGWKEDLELMRSYDRKGAFLVYPGFEIHSMESGDYTVLTKTFDMDILYPKSIDELRKLLERDKTMKERILPFPHHIGYRKGRRGINWDSFSGEVFPLVEIYSMHGCAEVDENDKPFLHTMGPGSGYGTVRYGLAEAGKKFALVANTDHHSAHPGSYGHGMTGIWADSLDRQSVWEALWNRRTYALSADKMSLEFSLNGLPMGSRVEDAEIRKSGGGRRRLDFRLKAGGPLDYVDIVKNGNLFSRFSPLDFAATGEVAKASGAAPSEDSLQGEALDSAPTILFLELGWGERNVPFEWNVVFGVDEGRIEEVDARFRGDEVVSPLDAKGEMGSFFRSSWNFEDERTVAFTTETSGNPTNSTPATQGMALDVRVPSDASVYCSINGKEYRFPLEELAESSFVDNTGGFDSPAFKLHRAPSAEEFIWSGSVEDDTDGPTSYYLRARQKNGAWVWSSPIWVE